MSYALSMLVALLAQAAPYPEGPRPSVAGAALPVSGDEGVQLARYFDAEHHYATRLGQVLGQDLSDHWADYQDDEKDRADARADGDDDEDSEVQSFALYMDDRYRRRLKPGGIMLGVGFAPLGFGLYIGLTLGEGAGVGLAMAGIGGGVIIAGAVLLAVRGTQLSRLRDAQDWLTTGRPHARLRWRGLAPIYNPHLRTHGVSLGFAF